MGLAKIFVVLALCTTAFAVDENDTEDNSIAWAVEEIVQRFETAERFAEREKASDELQALGLKALSAVLAINRREYSREVGTRLDRYLNGLPGPQIGYEDLSDAAVHSVVHSPLVDTLCATAETAQNVLDADGNATQFRILRDRLKALPNPAPGPDPGPNITIPFEDYQRQVKELAEERMNLWQEGFEKQSLLIRAKELKFHLPATETARATAAGGFASEPTFTVWDKANQELTVTIGSDEKVWVEKVSDELPSFFPLLLALEKHAEDPLIHIQGKPRPLTPKQLKKLSVPLSGRVEASPEQNGCIVIFERSRKQEKGLDHLELGLKFVQTLFPDLQDGTHLPRITKPTRLRRPFRK